VRAKFRRISEAINIQALNLDGSQAPFYAESRRMDALVLRQGRRQVRVDGSKAPAWIVAELYAMLEELAEQYEGRWRRPPRLREIVRYVAHHLEKPAPLRTCTSDTVPWDFRDAKLVMGERKPTDRASPPETTPELPRSGGRVRHPKFGDGVIVAEQGDRLTVQFGSDRRVLLRAFVTPLR
jgi:hypothetical protein